MTEAEWLACRNPGELVDHLSEIEASARKFRLFACACCRRLWNLLQVEAARRIVELAEAYADGEVSAAELQAANAPASFADFHDRYHGLAEPRLSIRAGDAVFASQWLASPTFNPGTAVSVATYTSKDPALDYFREPDWEGLPAGVPPSATERAEQVTILRDIFGNPFRPVAFDPTWRTSTVVGLANLMYKSRDFSAMPILADALQDAGCHSEEILNHCLGEGPHVRGCWAVDLVMAKA